MPWRMKIFDFFDHGSTKIGYAGTVFYWIFENQDAVLGSILTCCMVISSIAYHTYKVIGMRNEERRREERHRQELLQDQQRHDRDLNQ